MTNDTFKHSGMEKREGQVTIDLHTIVELRNIEVSAGYNLRPMELSDATEILSILDKDPNIRKRVAVAAAMVDLESFQKEVEEYKQDPTLIRYVLSGKDGLVGLVSLWQDTGFYGLPPNLNSYGFGIFIDPEMRGKGLAASSTKAIMGVVEKCLNPESFIAFCEDDNIASQTTLRTAGMEPTEVTFIESTYGWVERLYKKNLK